MAATLLAAAVSLGSGLPARAADEPARVRGTLVALEGTKLTVHDRDGKDVAVTLTPDVAVFAVVKADRSDIKQGTFIGTASLPQSDESLLSLELVVFPESLRGFGEGHYPWDLTAKSMMTNATVSHLVQSSDGDRITVSYKGGSKNIKLPKNVPIVALTAATKADLKPGAIVFVPGKKDGGTITAGAILYGKDGLTPPM